jgi:uncharacterized repeat protein (TIGR01451 family)
MSLNRFLANLAKCCMAVLAVLAFALVGGAQAQTISNVARASWDAAGTRTSINSNSVVLTVTQPQARLSTMVIAPGSGQSLELYQSYCSAQPARGTAALGSNAAATISVAPSSTVRVGQTLVIRLDDPQGNRDPAAIDRIELRVQSAGQDSETLTALETAPNSGVFVATVQTQPRTSQSASNDCALSLEEGEQITISAMRAGQTTPFLVGNSSALADPFGVIFDSLDGRPVDGATVTVVNADTGQPAQVFAFDGVTPYPSTVISGASATDASGLTLDFAPGEYRFPLVAYGRYRLVITPPAPYSAPSGASQAQLAALRDGAGRPFDISAGSFGGAFVVDSPVPVQVDVPVDGPGGQVVIEKRASRTVAEPGDAVFYTITVRNSDAARPTRDLVLRDSASASLRLRADSVRVNGQPLASGLAPAAAGRGFTLPLGRLAAGEAVRITYAMSVREDARPGQAPNSAIVESSDNNHVGTMENLRIVRDGLTARMTIIGRVVDGACGPVENAVGIPGVRVMLEDGSYAITDADGRYHFEGVVPGNHVVQVAQTTLPQGGEFIDCVASSRSAGSAISRFVSGQGGSLARADFHARLPERAADAETAAPQRAELDNVAASGAGIDFVGMGDGPDGFLFPAADHNPRSPSVRVAIRHRGRHRVELTVNGRAVDPLSFDGSELAPNGSFAVSTWRALPLEGPRTVIRAEIRDRSGTLVLAEERIVHYATTPMRAEVVAEQSHLVADGATSPVLAVRLLDRYNQPVHAGISGTLQIDSPYQTMSALDAQQANALSGFGSSAATWTVEGDDGIAYIDLAPTMVSGALRARFAFNDGDTAREREIEAWITPGDQPWTLIGIAEGSIGARTIAENMERDGDFDSDLGDNARVAFYAKGRVLGEYLLTVAYDSASQQADERLLGAIDPAAYYTVFGDRSQRLFDAASRDKIYIRVESSVFYALYGDFETGFDETDLARYQRIVTGVRAEARLDGVQVQAFAADVGSLHRREELQGDGTTGPYRLGSRAIIPNSEVVAIEVRDRLRGEIIVNRRELTRFIDYNIDLLSGTISFADPVLSRDAALNPRFIVIDYDVDALGAQQLNGGARFSWTSENQALRIGATALSDRGDGPRTNLSALDVTARLGTATELRAEAAISETAGQSGSAYLAEVEHVSDGFDMRAYARQIDSDYGVDQQNLAERGMRKIGFDTRLHLGEELTVSGSVWHEDSLQDASNRDAVEVRLAWQTESTDAFVGVAHLDDSLADGRQAASTVLQAGATQRLLDNRLELSAATSLPVGGTEAVDLPARHTFGARFAVTPDVRVLGTYEVARGSAVDANTAKVGIEVTPWQDARLVGALGNESFGTGLQTDAERQFAAVTLGQSVRIGESLVIDATVDANKTLAGGIDAADLFNSQQPASSGGQISADGLLGEDFTAVTLGASWSQGPWSARTRGEYRDGEFANRTGFNLAAIRQLGEGSAVGGGVTWTRAENAVGGFTEIVDAALSAAHRPDGSDLSFLGKLEYRSDEVSSAVDGTVTGAGRTALLASGDARSRRLLATVSSNWTPQDDEDASSRTEVSVMTGIRYNFDELVDYNLAGTTVLAGADVRIGIGDRVEVGGRATVRHDLQGGTTAFAVGPEIGFVPVANMIVSIGYNVVGFRDADFSEARTTDRGLFATVRIKFDDFSLEQLGIGGR